MAAVDRAEPGAEPGPAESRVTVVIATRNRRQSVLNTLRQVTALPERPPVVVVDNDSEDGTAEAVRAAFPEVTVIALDRNRGVAARNLGVEAARTPYAAFCDDDSWWAPGALPRAAEVLDRRPRLAVVAARTLVGPQERFDPIGEVMERSPLRFGPDAAGPGVLGFLACSAVVRRSAFLEVGGFCELLVVSGEERLLAYDLVAAGWESAYVGSIVAHHHPERRDGSARGVLARRNDLLIDAMRRPWPVVLGAFAASARRAFGDARERQALKDAVRAMPAALRLRRRVPESVEAAIKVLASAR